VKVAAVPQIEGLTIEDFLKQAKKKANVPKLVPDERDWSHLDKKWVCDVMYSVDTQTVNDMISIAVKARKHRIEMS